MSFPFGVPPPLSPSAFNPTGDSALRLAEVPTSPDPMQPARFLAPFELAPLQRVAGFVESEKPVKRDDDCAEAVAPAKAKPAKEKVRVKPKAVVLPRPALSDMLPGKKLDFSESLQHAQKRFKPPAKVAPQAPPQKIC